MTKEQLAEAHATAIRKHYRRLEDKPGRVHAELLADLAHIADEHAADRVAADRALAARSVPLTDDSGHPLRHDGTQIPPSPKAAARRAARVRGDVP